MSSTINLVLPFNETNTALVKTLLAKADLTKSVSVIEESAEAPAAKAPVKKAPPRKAPAKKPEPVEEDEDEDDDFATDDEDDDFATDDEDEDEDEVTEDLLREMAAKHMAVDNKKKNSDRKDAIIAALAKKKDKSGKPVKGWGNLQPKDYQYMHDFMTKLK